MKMKFYMGLFLLAAMVAWPQTNSLTALLQQGLLEEQANRNFDAAIADYQSLALQFDKDRQLAATAVFRLGECYRAQGRTNEAAAQYQRILHDFFDQQTLATLSRQDLAGMGAQVDLSAQQARQQQMELLAKQIALAEQDVTDKQQQFKNGLASQAEVRVAEREVLRLRQQLSALEAKPGGLADLPPPVNSAEASVLAMQISGIEKLKSDPEEQARAVLAIFPDDLLKKMLLHLPNVQAQAARMEANPQMSYAELTGTSGYAVAIGMEAETLRGEMHSTNLLADVRSELSKQRQGIAERVDFILGIQKARLKALQVAAGPAARPETDESGVAHSLADDERLEIQRIEEMIQNSPDLINAPRDGSTPLTEAAYHGWLKVAAYLLDHGADVNVPSPNVHWTKELADARHVTPLLAAVAAGNKSMTKFLIDRGADLNAKGELGDTALHLAARKGFLAVVEVLLARHAEVNAQNSSGATPLFLAVQGGQTKIIQMLLAAGADPNLKDGGGRTGLNYAIGTSPEVYQTLLAAGTNPNTEDTEGRTPLSYASERDSSNAVKLLLAAKADPNGGKLDAPLMGAIEKQDATSAELLLQAGANPKATGTINWAVTVNGMRGGKMSVSPLYFAATENRLPMVRLLLKYHADPNDLRTEGQSMLFHILMETNILDALLEAGAKADVSRPDGWTLLAAAVDRRNVTAVRLLLKFKADPNHSQMQGRSILFSALSDTNILAALLDAGASVDPVTKDESNLTPLCVAARDNNTAAVKLLLEHGANPNVRTANGATPLHLATYGPADREVFELLLAHQADPNVRNSNGETPLDVLKNILQKSATQNNFAARFASPMPQPMPRGPRPGIGGEPADSKPNLSAGELAEVLRQHGALDRLPDWDCITVSRPAADFSFPILHQGTNDWNQFTLLETLYNFFNSSQSYSVPQGNNTWAGYPVNSMLPFADLSRVTIVRPVRGSTNETRRVVNLLNSTNGIDVSKDLLLEFGDVVEIPERDHALGERAAGLTDSERATLSAFAKAAVQLVAHGQTVELPFWRLDGQATLGFLLNQSEAQRILLSSSDLSRVKVTRRDPKTGQKREWILDCRPPASAPNGAPGAPGLPPLAYQWNPGANNAAPSPGLWLRDADVIEVPEKP